jgi:hypothetical protein
MKELDELLSFIESACNDDGSNHAAAYYHFNRIRRAYRKYKAATLVLDYGTRPNFERLLGTEK